jgi:hypothetical protein
VYGIRIGGLITDMQFLNPDTGYASAYYPGSILSTYDGGETWNEVPAKYWLYGLHFSDSRHGWAVGNSLGEVLRTTDAGATWLPEATGATGNIKDVLKYSTTSTTIRPAGNPVGRGHAPNRFFDIRGARLAPEGHGAIWRVVPGRMPLPFWPSNGSTDISE